MKNKLTWISWMALGLMAITTGVLLYFFPLPQIGQKIMRPDYRYSLILPLLGLASYAFITFLAKTKAMSREYRLPWIFYAVSMFGLLFLVTSLILDYVFPFINSWKLLFFLFLIVSLATALALIIGAILETTKQSWKGRTSFSQPFVVLILALVVGYAFANNNFLAKDLLITIISHLTFIFLFIVIIQKAKTEPVSIPYKIILLGLIVVLACSLYNDFFGQSSMDYISSIVFLTCTIVAVDIRTQIWLEESSVKSLPETEEIKC